MEVDTLKCPLDKIGCCYANPPWSVIGKWLHRIREIPKLTCMMITPYLVSAPMMAPTNQTASKVDPCFSNTPLPRDVQQLLWRINASSQMAPADGLCIILSGKAYRPNKSALKLQTLI